MGIHFFEIVQGFLAMLVLGLAAVALLVAATVARKALGGIGWRLNRLRRRTKAKPRQKQAAPAKLRLVKPEPSPQPEPDTGGDDAEWLKEFG